MRYLFLLLLLPSLAFADDDDDYEAARQMRKQIRDAQDEETMRDAQIQDMQNTLDDMAKAQKEEKEARDQDAFERNINSFNKSLHLGKDDD